MLDQRLRLARVVTLVDAVTGADTLARFAEAARQAAVADALVISKTDLAPFGDALRERLDALNPGAERIVGAAASDPAAVLFRRANPHPNPPRAESGGGAAEPSSAAARPSPPPPLAGEGRVGVLPRQRQPAPKPPTPTASRPSRSSSTARSAGSISPARSAGWRRSAATICCGSRASSRFADRPDRPAVVQAAQHAMFTPEWLDAWPDADRRSRLVFIVHDIAPDEILARFAFASPRSGSRLRPHASTSTRIRGGFTCSTP